MNGYQKNIFKEIRRIKNHIEDDLKEDTHFPSTILLSVAKQLGTLEQIIITFPMRNEYQRSLLIKWYVEYNTSIKSKLIKKFRVTLREEVREIEAEQH